MRVVSALVPTGRCAGRLNRWFLLLAALGSAVILLAVSTGPRPAAASRFQDDGSCPLVEESYVVAVGVDPAAAPTVDISENGVLCYFLSAPPAELYNDPDVAQVRSLIISVGFADTKAQLDRIVARLLDTGAELYDAPSLSQNFGLSFDSAFGSDAAGWIKRTPGNPNAKTKTFGFAGRALNRRRQERLITVVAVTDVGTDAGLIMLDQVVTIATLMLQRLP
jgi:hypothetical protein